MYDVGQYNTGVKVRKYGLGVVLQVLSLSTKQLQQLLRTMDDFRSCMINTTT